MRVRQPKPVLLVHGIASDGEWHDELREALQGNFQPVPIKYRHFRGWIGPLLVICEPWLVLAAAVLAAVLALFFLPLWNAVAIASLVLVLAFLPIGVQLRRHYALQTYHRAAGDHLSRRPHVIAHSFGTFLTARLLDSVNGLSFSRVVLCGCVLPRDFDWRSLLRTGKVDAVRNDYTRGDWVGMAAKLAGRLHSGLGNAGTHGMAPELVDVHRLQSPEMACPHCAKQRLVHPLHDVDCSNIGHSTTLLIRSHFRSWWLLFLWGHDPGEVQGLYRQCEAWIDARRRHDWDRIGAIEQELDTREWVWCQGDSVARKIARARSDSGKSTDPQSIWRTFDAFAVLVSDAMASELGTRQAKFLEPDFAINAAVHSVS